MGKMRLPYIFSDFLYRGVLKVGLTVWIFLKQN